MGSLRKRLEKLEVRAKTPAKSGIDPVSDRLLTRLFEAGEDAGEPLPYDELDAEIARQMLREGLPSLRDNLAWQGEREQLMLDEWERDLVDELSHWYAKEGDR